MSTLKRLVKRVVIDAVAAVAPLTWRWRPPGSLVVLMYHRVLPKDSPARQSEQPGMYVSPETLDLHLAELKRHFELVHLDDWLRRAKEGQPLPKLACALTFDDGWRDNYDFALPVLMKHQAPATIFLVSSYIGTAQRFWPNRLIKLVLMESAQPGSVPFPAKLRQLVEPLLNSSLQGSIGVEEVAPIVRQALGLKESEIRELIDSAATQAQLSEDDRDILDQNEIVRMASTGLVRFGSHSITHFRLDESASEKLLQAEIVQSRAQLQEVCGQPINLFCYPNGITCAAAVELTSRHYLGAVNTDTGWYSNNRNPFLVPRIRLHDDITQDRQGFLARVSAWL